MEDAHMLFFLGYFKRKTFCWDKRYMNIEREDCWYPKRDVELNGDHEREILILKNLLRKEISE